MTTNILSNINDNLNGNFLKQIRVYALNLSQKEFAEQVGVSVPQISRWENNNCKPCQDSVQKIVTLLEIKYQSYVVE